LYAGEKNEFVVQFRLKPLSLELETIALVGQIFGALVPRTKFHGQMGDAVDGKEVLIVYIMDRVQGVAQIDFELAQEGPRNSPEFFAWR
jgi:hypothetical protein